MLLTDIRKNIRRDVLFLLLIIIVNMDEIMWHSVIRFGLVRIFSPCLMIFGTIGNVLCLQILLRKRFRRQSTCQYLCILAVIDILFIYMRSTRYLYRYISTDVDLRNTSLWICRIFIYFSSSLSHLASWILVIVSFDRYLIIKNLFLRRHVGWRVIKSTSILILIICILNLHYFRILGTNMPIETPVIDANTGFLNETFYNTTHFVCMAPEPYKVFFRLYLPIFDLFFVAIIPFCLMMFTNIGIIQTIMHSNMLCTTSRKQQRNNRLTIMLLSVTLAFMLLTCPSVIYICLNRLAPSKTYSDKKLLVLDLLESLWYTKHAMNFILYTLSGQDFRREFIKLISCSRKKTSNTWNNTQKSRNNGRTIGPNVFSEKSLLVNKLVIERGKERQNNEINGSSSMIISKLSQRKSPEHMDGGLDGNFIVLTASSSAQTATSINSDPGRSSSTTRTSTN